MLRTVRWRHENVACVEPVLADDTAGAVALVVDAVPSAVDFYRKCNFEAVQESPGSKTVFMALSLGDKEE